jgi:hypothetical protein
MRESTRRRLTLRILPAGALAAGLVATAIAASGPAGAQTPLVAQLPDLVEATPAKISVKAVPGPGAGTRYRLAFRSAAENHGDGTNGGGNVVLVGSRPDRDSKLMRVDQYIDLFDPHTGQIAGQQQVADVGRMRFVTAADHRHWHVLGFERYELRRAADHLRVAQDRKTGFCVGNRYRVGAGAARGNDLLRGVRAAQVISFEDFNSHCGLARPDLKTVTTGLSPGWGDDYAPLVEGQFIDVTTLRSGRYELVHRVNAESHLREARYDNNAASVLLDLRRRHGRAPAVRVLRRCAGSARCPAGFAAP